MSSYSGDSIKLAEVCLFMLLLPRNGVTVSQTVDFCDGFLHLYIKYDKFKHETRNCFIFKQQKRAPLPSISAWKS